ncbi:MAG: CoA pyrophosphatase [Bacteroidia bacterium]|nr:CoA pyrophosphatase [Bacteroidia bacterium]
MFSSFVEQLKVALHQPLPGEEAHKKMMPAYRKPLAYNKNENAKQSAVLILLYPSLGKGINTVLIQRPVYDGVHSGQIAFPGGKFEDDDIVLEQTALREANEEIGIEPNSLTIINSLTPIYISPSNFMVTPYVAYTHKLNRLNPNEFEVERILHIDISQIKNENNIVLKKVNHSSGLKIETPCYEIDGNIIWGATAMMLSEFNAVLNKI